MRSKLCWRVTSCQPIGTEREARVTPHYDLEDTPTSGPLALHLPIHAAIDLYRSSGGRFRDATNDQPETRPDDGHANASEDRIGAVQRPRAEGGEAASALR